MSATIIAKFKFFPQPNPTYLFFCISVRILLQLLLVKKKKVKNVFQKFLYFKGLGHEIEFKYSDQNWIILGRRRASTSF
jgi:hypothetical protein